MWEINAAGQGISFLLAFLTGAALCLYYCFFKALRQVHGFSKTAVFFQDIFFWLTCAVVSYCFFILRSAGQIRGFGYLGQALGFIAFRLLLSKYAVKLLAFPLRLGCRIISVLGVGARRFRDCFTGICEKAAHFAKKCLKKIKFRSKKGLKAQA